MFLIGRFLKIVSSETAWPNEQSLERTFHRCFLPSFSSFGREVSEEKIKMRKVNERRTTDAKWWQKLTLPMARWAKKNFILAKAGKKTYFLDKIICVYLYTCYIISFAHANTCCKLLYLGEDFLSWKYLCLIPTCHI